MGRDVFHVTPLQNAFERTTPQDAVPAVLTIVRATTTARSGEVTSMPTILSKQDLQIPHTSLYRSAVKSLQKCNDFARK